MEHRSAGSVEWTRAPSDHFTGSVLFGPYTSDGVISVLGVEFEPGARTDWHSHPEGQVLYVVAGAGRVGTQAGAIAEVAAGDVVYAPPGEVHWHGASPTSPMTHLSLTTDETVWHPDKVTDEQYG